MCGRGRGVSISPCRWTSLRRDWVAGTRRRRPGAYVAFMARRAFARLQQPSKVAFSVVRTMSEQEIQPMLAPIEGRIWVHDGMPRHEP